MLVKEIKTGLLGEVSVKLLNIIERLIPLADTLPLFFHHSSPCLRCRSDDWRWSSHLRTMRVSLECKPYAKDGRAERGIEPLSRPWTANLP